MYNDRAIIPSALRNEVLDALHSAHQGASTMTARAQTSVFWPGLIIVIQKRRDQCAHHKHSLIFRKRLSKRFFADSFEFQGWHYLIIDDRLTGWTSAYRMETGTQESGAKGLGICGSSSPLLASPTNSQATVDRSSLPL